MATGRLGWSAAVLVLGLGCGGEGGRGDGDEGKGGLLSLDGGIQTSEGESEGMEGSSTSGGQPGSGGQDEGSEGADDDPPSTAFDLGGTPPPSGCNPGEVGGGGGTFSYIWIGNSPQGTVSKIDTETGVELGRYRSSAGVNSPSRTSVNQYGDVAAGNRGEVGSITKIAAEEERCVEINGVPGIQTSTGPDDVLDYGQDECVLWSTPIPSSDYNHGPRGVAWEGGEIDPVTCTNTVPNPRLWVSWHGAGSTIEFRRLDGDTGAILDSVAVQGGGGRTYGGAVNAEGDFWVATRGGQDNLIHVDGITLAATVYDVPVGDNYGMTVDKNGDPWVVTYNDGTNYVYRLDVASGAFVTAATSQARFRGIQIDREGRAWIAGNSPCRLSLVDAENDALVDDAIPLPGCGTPVGTSIDRDGFVWVVDQGTSTAYKVDPDTHDVVLSVTGLVQPYTYSDMTGSGLDLVINPPG